MEISENKWQPIEVSSNIASGQLFQYLPTTMISAPWEILFLLLLSPTLTSESSSVPNIDNEIYQTFFDTGLSPKQGLFAYMRLLEQVTNRAQIWENIPAYRKVSETEISF